MYWRFRQFLACVVSELTGAPKTKPMQKFVFCILLHKIQTFITNYVSHEFVYPEGEILTPFKSGSVLNARHSRQQTTGTWVAHANSRQQTTGK